MNSQFDEYSLYAYDLILAEKYEAAISVLKKALKIKPKDSNALNLIGYSFLMLEHYDKAEKCLKRSLNINSSNIISLVDYGLLLQKQGNLEGAEQFFKKALNIDSNDIYALGYIGDFYLLIENYDLAVRYYDEYLKLDNTDANVLTSKSIALLKEDNVSEALKTVEESIKCNPNLAMAWLIRAKVAYKLENSDDEIRYCKKALELEPCNCNALFHIKEALSSQSNYVESERYRDKLLKSDCIILEKQLEQKLIVNLNLLKKFGHELKLIERQYSCKNHEMRNRYIDVLCKDDKDDFVIIELKIVEASVDTYDQIKEYMEIIKFEKNTQKVKGLVISDGFNKEFDDKLKVDGSLFQININDLGFYV